MNGITVGTTSGQSDQMSTFDIPTADFFASGNVLEFDVTNSNAPVPTNATGFDFKGTAIAATPEPSSLILLGSGLMSAAGMVIRRRRNS